MNRFFKTVFSSMNSFFIFACIPAAYSIYFYNIESLYIIQGFNVGFLRIFVAMEIMQEVPVNNYKKKAKKKNQYLVFIALLPPSFFFFLLLSLHMHFLIQG